MHSYFTDYSLSVDETVSLVASTAPAPTDCGCYDAETEAASPASVRWHGVLGMEGELTGDGRYIQPEALRWEELPVPLRYVPADTGAHQGAVVVGRIDSIERREDGTIWGSGDFDMASQYGPEAARQVKEKYQNGVSLDLDDVAFEVRIAADAPALMTVDPKELAKTGTPDEDGRVKVQEMSPDDEVMVTTDARVRAATIVSVPAFATAKIDLADEDTTEFDAMVAEHIDVTEDQEAFAAYAGVQSVTDLEDPTAFNWVDDVGGLPQYIDRIRKHLQKKGMDESHAIATAVNVVKKMCATGDVNFPGKQDVNAGSRAEACAAVADWEAKKKRAHADSAETDEFEILHAPPGPGGGQFIGPGGSGKGSTKKKDDGKDAKPEHQAKSKAERIRLLTRQINKELDALMANLNDKRAIAFVKNLRNNAAKIIDAQVQNAPSHPAGSSGGTSGGGKSSGGKASGGKATTTKSGGKSSSGSSSGGSSSGGSSGGGDSLDGMVQGLVAGIEKAVKTFDLKLGPKDKAKLQDLTKKLSQTIAPKPKLFTVNGVTFNSNGEILPTTLTTPAIQTFGYNEGQWRDPHSGKWIDMPDRALQHLLQDLRADPRVSNETTDKVDLLAGELQGASDTEIRDRLPRVKEALNEAKQQSGPGGSASEAIAEARHAIDTYDTNYVPSEQSDLTQDESTDIGAGEDDGFGPDEVPDAGVGGPGTGNREDDYGPIETGDRVIVDTRGRIGKNASKIDGQEGTVEKAAPKNLDIRFDNGEFMRIPRSMVQKNNSGLKSPQIDPGLDILDNAPSLDDLSPDDLLGDAEMDDEFPMLTKVQADKLRTTVATMGVPGMADEDDPNADVPFDDRLGNCYEFAAKYATENDGTLVHGTIQGDGADPLQHAWVELPDGDIFEPTSGHSMTAQAFADWAHPVENERFTATEAAKQMVQSGHFGPWAPPANSDLPEDLHPSWSLAAHVGPDGKLTRERQALHDRIVGQLLDGHSPSDDPTFTFMGGGPASGKSTVLKSGGIEVAPDSVTINADDIKEMLPEYNDLKNQGDSGAAGYVHEESSMIAARVQREVTARKMNAVLDATGDHSLEKARSKIQRVKDAGYKINGVYTTIDIEEAKKRAKARGDKTGRYIPDDFLQHAHQTVAAIVPEVVDMFDDFVLYDTTEKPPKLLFSNHGGTMQIEDQDGYTAFLQRGKTS